MPAKGLAIPETGSEGGYQDLSGFDELGPSEPPKPQVLWQRCSPSVASCRPAARSFHAAVRAGRLARSGDRAQTVWLLGGDTEPKYRGPEMQPITFKAISPPPKGDDANDAASTASAPQIAKGKSGGNETAMMSPSMSMMSRRSGGFGGLGGSLGGGSGGLGGEDGEEAEEPPEPGKLQWSSCRCELPTRLRGCSVAVSGSLLFVFGGLRLDTVTGRGPAGEGLYQSNQVAGELHIFNGDSGKWRTIQSQLDRKLADANNANNNNSNNNSNTDDGKSSSKKDKRQSTVQRAGAIPEASGVMPQCHESDWQYSMEGEAPRARFEHASTTLEAAGTYIVVHGGRSAKHAYPIESSFVLHVRGKTLRWTRLHPGRVGSAATQGSQDHGQLLQSQARKKQFTRRGHTLCAVPNQPGRVALFGGRMDSGEEGRICAELMMLDINPATGNYMILPNSAIGAPPSARIYHSAAVVGIFLIIFGGLGRKGEIFNDLYLLHMGAMIWTKLHTPCDAEAAGVVWPSARLGAAAVVVERPACSGGDCVLIFGGAPEVGGSCLDEVYCLSLLGPLTLSSSGAEAGAQAFAIYPDNAVLSLWDRLHTNLSSLEHDQMMSLSRLAEENQEISDRVMELENRMITEESNAAVAGKAVTTAGQDLIAAKQRLQALRAELASEQRTVSQQIQEAEAKVDGMRDKVQRFEVQHEILEQKRLLPADQVWPHPDDPGALISFALGSTGGYGEVVPQPPNLVNNLGTLGNSLGPGALAASMAGSISLSRSDSKLSTATAAAAGGSSTEVNVRRRAGFWGGCPIALEEFFLPPWPVEVEETHVRRPTTQAHHHHHAASAAAGHAHGHGHHPAHRPRSARAVWQGALLKELKILGKLQHPNLVEYYGATAEGDVLNLVAEAPLVPLLSELESRSNPQLELGRGKGRLSVSLDVALALEFLHSRGIVHRRVSIGRIYLRDAPRLLAKLGDLFPSRLLTRTTRECGAISHARQTANRGRKWQVQGSSNQLGVDANQGASNEPSNDKLPPPAAALPDPRAADVLALGVIALQLFSLEVPGRNLAAAGGSPLTLNSAAVGRIQDRGLRLVVMRCMEKDPNHRMSASVAARALDGAMRGDAFLALEATAGDLSRFAPLVDPELEVCEANERRREMEEQENNAENGQKPAA